MNPGATATPWGATDPAYNAQSSVDATGIAVDGHDLFELREQQAPLIGGESLDLGDLGAGLQGPDVAPHLAATLETDGLDPSLDQLPVGYAAVDLE